MKALNIFTILILISILSTLVSCNNKEDDRIITGYKEYTITVASQKVIGLLSSCGNNYVSDVYAVMKEHSAEWEQIGYIDGFDYETGYEYTLHISETSYLDHSMGEPAWTEYELMELISKEEKKSEDIPNNFIPEWFYTEYCENIDSSFKYFIDAEDKSVIEEDVNSNPIVTFSGLYCYIENDWTRWFLINDNKEIAMFGFIKKENKELTNISESYKSLIPEGAVQGLMEWTFIIGNNPENEENAIKYDVFICSPSKSKSAGPTSVPWFYKDFTQYYQEKYPEAGVKAVAVRYNIK